MIKKYNQPKKFQKNPFLPFIVLLITLFCVSCSQKIKTDSSKSQNLIILETRVLVFQNGVYEELNTENKPEPINGEDKFYRDMYSKLRYPANARENNIQGSVLFELEINEEGIVESIKKIQSLSAECDREAESAIRRGCKDGFKPYKYDGSVVRVKYLIPVNFRLE